MNDIFLCVFFYSFLHLILVFYFRAAIWEQNFRPFMDERARRKRVRDENDLMRGSGKGRKKYAKKYHSLTQRILLRFLRSTG